MTTTPIASARTVPGSPAAGGPPPSGHLERSRAARPERSTAPRFLRIILAAAVSLVVAFTVVVAAVLAGSLARVTAAQDAAADVVRLGETRVALARADVAATDWLIDPTPANRSAVGDALTEALQNSAISDPASESDLASLHAAVVRYAMQLQAAFDATGATAADKVSAARALGSGEVTSALDAVAARRLAAVTDSLTDNLEWVIHLAGTLALIGLVAISFLLARRTRRVVNLGLAGALVAVAVVWVVAGSGLGGSATTDSDLARGAADLQHGVVARALVTGSLATTGQEVAQPGSAGSFTSTRADALTKARAAVSALASPGTLPTKLSQAGDAEAKVEASVKANRVTEAKSLLPTAKSAVAAFDSSARTALAAVKAQVAASLNSRSTTVITAIVAAAVLAALGVVAAVIGLGQRLREYR